MKRRIVTAAVLLLAVAAIVAAFVLLRGGDTPDVSDAPAQSEPVSVDESIEYIRYDVYRGDMKSTYDFTATAEMADGAVKTLTVASGEEILVTRGENVPKGGAISTSVTAETPVKIINITASQDGTAVEYLDYSHVTLTARLSHDLYRLVKYDSDITVSDGIGYYPATVEEIGYTFSGGTFELRLSSDALLLPGETADCTLAKGVKSNVLWLPAEAVFFDGEEYYVNMLDENRAVFRRTIIVGEMFTVTEDNAVHKNYEITSGIKEGEAVFVPSIVTDKEQEVEG